MEFRILGPLELVNGSGPVPVDAPKQRALLGVLLLHPNEVVSTDRLIDELWGERPPATAGKIVQTYVSQLRRALGPELIETRPPGYLLPVEDGALDANRFRRLVEKAREHTVKGKKDEAAACYREALALWRGPPLIDVAFESFARNEVERLEEERLSALMDRIDCELELGLHDGLVPELEALTTRHPLRERLRAQLMLALYRSGRQADALAAYRAARRTLVDELGLEPGAALHELEQAILRHDPTLDAPERANVLGPAPAQRSRGWLLALPTVALVAALVVALLVALDSGSGGISTVSANAVGVIDVQTNELVAEVAVGAAPEAVAVGEGAVWVANVEDETVSRIDPDTRRLVRTIPVDDYPSDIAVGKGSVWVALGPLALLSRVAPEQDLAGTPIVALGEGLACGSPAASVAVGDGAVWYACQAGDLGRVNSRTGEAIRVGYESGLLTSSSPVRPEFSDVAFGLGSVWLSNRGANMVVRLEPRTNRWREITVGQGPTALAADATSLWVANYDDDTVWRIGLTDRVSPLTVKIIEVGHGPLDVAVGEDGVWVANSRDGTVSRIDPGRNEVVATIKVGNEPRRLAVGEGAVWVTVRAPDDEGRS